MHRKENESQQRAIQHGAGPAMVLAGPGSGKTFVITNRIKYLIESYHISPENILVITFTKAASIEMKERFQKLIGNKTYPVHFGTFHAVFFHILQITCQMNASNIITETEKKEYLKEIMEDMKLYEETGELEELIPILLMEISMVKNMGIPIQKYHSKYWEEETFRKIYSSYRRTFERKRKLDFDDMVLSCYELLKRNKEVREYWRNQYQYILIDEFQDINYIQYRTIQLLAAPMNHLFVVGDDDQSIYGFRGANPQIMKRFPQDYLHTAQILLDINYRSTRNIVEASLQVIQENKLRYDKKTKSMKENGERIILHGFHSEEEETANILSLIKKLHEIGYLYQEIAVIYRTNARMGYLAGKFVLQKIPFQMKEKVTNIYDHFIVKDILAYMKFGKSKGRKEFLRIMNKPKRYISRQAISDEHIQIEKILRYYVDNHAMKNKLKKLEYDITILQSMNPYAAINYIRKGIGYEEYLKELSLKRQDSYEEWIDMLNEIQNASAAFQSIDTWIAYIGEMNEKMSQNNGKQKYKTEVEKRRNEKMEDAVQIVSMHGSKGLEYKAVILPDLNEGMMPHKKAVSREEIEEERRLFYVGITRAKERLFLFYLNEQAKQKEPSRFLQPLRKITLPQ